jgi:transcriptional regulator with XRE-family HTH domain
MVDRIKSIMVHYQLRAAQFSDAIGMQRSAVSHVLSGRNKPSLDFVLRIKNRFPEISLDWLTLGKGNMLESETSGEQDLFAAGVPAAHHSPVATKIDEGEPQLENKPAETEQVLASGEESPTEYVVKEATGKVSRVLFIYSDGTFQELSPR